EPLPEGHRVEGPAFLGELAYGAEDELVVPAIEVAFDQAVRHGVVGLGRKHQSAQDGLLGLHRLRRHAQLVHALFCAGLEAWVGVPETWACTHGSCCPAWPRGGRAVDGNPRRWLAPAVRKTLWISSGEHGHGCSPTPLSQALRPRKKRRAPCGALRMVRPT